MTKVVYANREIIMAGILVFACLAISYFFPAKGSYQSLASTLVFLALIPIIYVKLILKKNLSAFGVQVGDWRKGLVGIVISLVVAFLAAYILFSYSDFLEARNFIKVFKNHFGKFLLYEIFFVGTLAATFEFFFRGFVMESARQKMGSWSIFAQFAILLFFLALSGDFNFQTAYFMIVAPLSGAIAYYSRSLIYSTAFSLIFMLVADAVVIRLIS